MAGAGDSVAGVSGGGVGGVGASNPGGAGSPADSAGAGGGEACKVDGAPCGSAGHLCSAGECVDVAASLSGLLWQLPCEAPHSEASKCMTKTDVTSTAVLGGRSGFTYDVTLHFRGVVERKTFTGGCPGDASWQTGGAENGDLYNVYQLTVSSPPQTFFLNVGASNLLYAFPVDFEKTIRVDAGATLTLFATSKDGIELKNIDEQSTPLVIDGASIAQPYDGQFIEVEVVSVEVDPVKAGVALSGGGGTALAFDGSMRATVADAIALHPASVTLEGWFSLDSAAGPYRSLLGKTWGSGTAASYMLWHENSGLHAGIGLSSSVGSATLPWSVFSEWHHAAMTWDASIGMQTLFVDGLPVSCVANPGPIPYDTHDLVIGGDIENGTPNGFWVGSIDELRVFSTARTGDQIWSDMHTHQLGPTSGLLAEWTFDEGSGQAAADSSGNAQDAVLGTSSAPEAIDPTWTDSGVLP